jgi:hypothetical protein
MPAPGGRDHDGLPARQNAVAAVLHGSLVVVAALETALGLGLGGRS